MRDKIEDIGNCVPFYAIYYLVSRQPNGENLEDGLLTREPNIFRVTYDGETAKYVHVFWSRGDLFWSMSSDIFPNNTERREFRLKV